MSELREIGARVTRHEWEASDDPAELVKQLRDAERCVRGGPSWTGEGGLFRVAADVIERLTEGGDRT